MDAYKIFIDDKEVVLTALELKILFLMLVVFFLTIVKKVLLNY